MSGRHATGHPLPGQPPENPLGVIVIGAGQAGLSAAGELVRRGAVVGEDLLVLDAEDGPGGAWRHRWESLTIGKAHRIADLPRFPTGDLDESRPSSAVVPEYYGRYEADRELHVLRPVRVTAVRSTDVPADPLRMAADAPVHRRVTGEEEPHDAGADAGPVPPAPGTAVDSASGAPGVRRDTLLLVEAETPEGPCAWWTRMVVSAAGTWRHPYVPHVPGIETFAGRQLHTATYRAAEDLAGRRVLVVGGGLSAVQMILEIAPFTASVAWATRRPPNFTFTAFDEIWGAEVEAAVNARTAAGARPVSVVRTTGIPMLPAYLDGVERGLLVSRGMFDLVRPDGVRFSPSATSQDPAGLGPSAQRGSGLVLPASWRPYEQDTWVQADTIFWNTGFRAALAHLDPLRLRERADDAVPGGASRDGRSGRDSGIRTDGRTGVVRDPRVLLVGYGSSASTLGAARAGAEAARRAAKRLGIRRRR